MIAGLCRPPPQTSHSRGGAGKCRRRRRQRRRSSRSASRRRPRPAASSGIASRKSSRSSDFGGRRAKYGCAEKPRDMRRRSPARQRASAPSKSAAGRCGAAPNRRSARCPARCRRRGCRPLRRRSRSRCRPRRGSAPRPASPASAASAAWYSGASGAPCPPAATSAPRKSPTTSIPVSRASSRAVADLPGAALGRTVQDRVAVKPDQVDRDPRDGGRETPRPRAACSRVSSASTAAISSRASAAEHAAQPLAERGAGRGTSAPVRERRCVSPSVDQRRDIDAVERGAAHQPQPAASAATADLPAVLVLDDVRHANPLVPPFSPPPPSAALSINAPISPGSTRASQGPGR